MVPGLGVWKPAKRRFGFGPSETHRTPPPSPARPARSSSPAPAVSRRVRRGRRPRLKGRPRGEAGGGSGGCTPVAGAGGGEASGGGAGGGGGVGRGAREGVLWKVVRVFLTRCWSRDGAGGGDAGAGSGSASASAARGRTGRSGPEARAPGAAAAGRERGANCVTRGVGPRAAEATRGPASGSGRPARGPPRPSRPPPPPDRPRSLGPPPSPPPSSPSAAAAAARAPWPHARETSGRCHGGRAPGVGPGPFFPGLPVPRQAPAPWGDSGDALASQGRGSPPSLLLRETPPAAPRRVPGVAESVGPGGVGTTGLEPQARSRLRGAGAPRPTPRAPGAEGPQG